MSHENPLQASHALIPVAPATVVIAAAAHCIHMGLQRKGGVTRRRGVDRPSASLVRHGASRIVPKWRRPLRLRDAVRRLYIQAPLLHQAEVLVVQAVFVPVRTRVDPLNFTLTAAYLRGA